MRTGMIITVLLLMLALILLVWLALRLKMQVRREQQLREETEASKQQIIVEQTRNRQLKQEMTNNIAHELKTPVSSIRGFLEILLGDKPVAEEQRRYFLERCYSQTLRLSDLINDVSLINKLEEANDLFNRETVNVWERAEEAIRELQPNAEQQHITIQNDLPKDMIIEGNSLLLYSIFRNLIENSITHAGEGVNIGMTCYRRDTGAVKREGPDGNETDRNEDYYFIQFYDTGKGVSNEYLPKLFDRFVRIDEGRSRKSGGTGLGLSIVKHAVLFHGGDIYVQNRKEGGLEFFFSLKKPH